MVTMCELGINQGLSQGDSPLSGHILHLPPLILTRILTRLLCERRQHTSELYVRYLVYSILLFHCSYTRLLINSTYWRDV